MTRSLKLIVRVALGVIAVLMILALSIVILFRSARLQNYVRQRLAAYIEQTTGGRTTIEAFGIDPQTLTMTAINVIVRGKEPPEASPFLTAPSVIVRLSFFSHHRIVNVEQVAIDRPVVNIVVLTNGESNLPEPPKPASGNLASGISHTMSAAVGQFDITAGQIVFADRTIPLNVHVRDLATNLRFTPESEYRGEIDASLALDYRSRLVARVTIPLTLRSGGIVLSQARLDTSQSSIVTSAEIFDLRNPHLSAQIDAHLSLFELRTPLAIPIRLDRNSPKSIDLHTTLDAAADKVTIQEGNLRLGLSRIDAMTSGDATSFQGSISLDEIRQLLAISEIPPGVVRLSGDARLAFPRYVIRGSLNASHLTLPYEDLGRADVSSDFRIEPSLITVSAFRVSALRTALSGSASVHNFTTIEAAAELEQLSVSRATRIAFGRAIGYSGEISASLGIRGLIRAPDLSAHVVVSPEGRGVPIRGQISLTYSVATRILALHDSSLQLPHSHLELGGTPGFEARLTFQSANISDLSPLSLFLTQSQLPFRSGSASLDVRERGPLDRAQVSGSGRLTSFDLSGHRFDNLSAQFTASPDEASVTNGSLTHGTSQTRFYGTIGLSHWEPRSIDPIAGNVTVDHGELSDFLLLAGRNRVQAGGEVNAAIRISGTIGNPQGSVDLTVQNGHWAQETFTKASLNARLADSSVDLSSLNVAAPAGTLEAHGSLRHPPGDLTRGSVKMEVATGTIDLSKVMVLQSEHSGLAGDALLNASAAGEFSRGAGDFVWSLAAINGDLKATRIRDGRDDFGDLTISARTRGQDAHVSIVSSVADSSTRLNGSVRLASDFPFTANVSVDHLTIHKLASLLRVSSPLTGTLNLEGHVAGVPRDPRANLTLQIANGDLFGERVDRLIASADYTSTLLKVSSLRAVTPAGRVDLTGSFSHPASSLADGRVALHVAIPSLNLGRVSHLQRARPGLSGSASLTADAAADLHHFAVALISVDSAGQIGSLALNREPLGSIGFNAKTTNGTVSINVHSDLAKSSVEGTASISLQPSYPAHAQLSFSGLTLSRIEKLVSPSDLPLEVAADGGIRFDGPLTVPEQATGQLQLSNLEIIATKEVTFRNNGPVTVKLDHASLATVSGRITGPSTDLTISGTVPLNKASEINVSIAANSDLGVLKTVFPGSNAGGIVDVNASIRGTPVNPQLGGRIQMSNASLQLLDWPNGIYNANASLLLTGAGGQIQSFTAESGGGKVNLMGFFGLSGSRVTYDFHADARQVRTHYAGASITANATLTLSGTNTSGLLNGTVTISRIGYGQQSDIGSILSAATKPAAPPSSVGGPLSGIRTNVRIQTASNVLFQTTLAQQLSATANLTLLGPLADPGMVGRINISSGTLVFFSNKYSVNRGSISFYDATSIQPVLDIDLETVAQGVDVNLTVTGPIDNLKLSYRSDPPLRFEDIIALLTAGKTPPDPTIAASQPLAPDQSAMQMGESALLGAAVANPVSSQLQRVFGVNQLIIAPTFVSGTALPQARVTLQQQVVQNVTVTYSQDVSQANAELIRLEWELTPKFSAVVTRDENGIFSVDFFWKKQFR